MPWHREDYKWILKWLQKGNIAPKSCSKAVLEKVSSMLEPLDPIKDNELIKNIQNDLHRQQIYRNK